MRVVLMPPDRDGRGFYRCLYPGKELARRGHLVVDAPHQVVVIDGRRLLVKYGQYDSEGKCLAGVDSLLFGADFDVLLMGQQLDPGIVGMVQELRRQGKTVIVDCDDDWLNVPKSNPASRRPREQVDRMLDLLRVASGVTVSTPSLAFLYRRFNRRVRVIRNALDWGTWADVRPVYDGRSWDRVRVGYMGSLKWHRGDLDVLRGVLGPWLERHPEVEFVAAGEPCGPVHDMLGVPEGQRVSVQSTEFWWRDLPDITAVMDIGLVPLARSVFNNGKSHLKGMEYAAAGIPCIATPSDSYRWWIEDGVNGFLAAKPRDWTRALDKLLDEALRTRMGQAARAKAARHTTAERADEWEDALHAFADRELPQLRGAVSAAAA